MTMSDPGREESALAGALSVADMRAANNKAGQPLTPSSLPVGSSHVESRSLSMPRDPHTARPVSRSWLVTQGLLAGMTPDAVDFDISELIAKGYIREVRQADGSVAYLPTSKRLPRAKES